MLQVQVDSWPVSVSTIATIEDVRPSLDKDVTPTGKRLEQARQKKCDYLSRLGSPSQRSLSPRSVVSAHLSKDPVIVYCCPPKEKKRWQLFHENKHLAVAHV